MNNMNNPMGKSTNDQDMAPRANYIAEGSHFSGTISAQDEEVIIAGKFEGNIHCKNLLIEGTGHLEGQADAETIKNLGVFNGDSTANSLMVGSHATISGTHLHHSLGVEPGATTRGFHADQPENQQVQISTGQDGGMNRYPEMRSAASRPTLNQGRPVTQTEG